MSLSTEVEDIQLELQGLLVTLSKERLIELIDAVIKCISPSLPLRDYIEAMREKRLMQFWRFPEHISMKQMQVNCILPLQTLHSLLLKNRKIF